MYRLIQLLILLSVLFLIGCGQKGPLYLPDQNQPGVEEQNSESEDEDTQKSES